jgi:hypothetical protein
VNLLWQILTLFFLLLQIGCSSTPHRDLERTVALPTDDRASQLLGWEAPHVAKVKQLYLMKCAKCHKLYSPTAYSDLEWHEWMQKMARKSKLTATQEQELSQYLNLSRTH